MKTVKFDYVQESWKSLSRQRGPRAFSSVEEENDIGRDSCEDMSEMFGFQKQLLAYRWAQYIAMRKCFFRRV